MTEIEFFVEGVPAAQGSMRAPKAGVVLHNSAKVLSWRDAVAWAAKRLWRGRPLLEGAIKVEAVFFFRAPKSGPHRLTVYKRTSPDLDKLLRAIGDALQGVIYRNDAQIVHVEAVKQFTVDEPGVLLHISEIGGNA